MAATEIPTKASLIEKVAKMPSRPVAFQALWDGDSYGWMVRLEAVLKSESGYSSSLLELLRFGGDIRVFQGVVPPWPEARVAGELGAALAEHFGVPFWFPSPTEPDLDCPDWWERDRALRCQDCGKLIHSQNSPYLADQLCPPCHMRRAERNRLRADVPENAEGVTVLLGSGTEDKRIGFSTHSIHSPAVVVVLETLARREAARAAGELVLSAADLQLLEAHLLARARALLDTLDRRPAVPEVGRGVGRYERVVFEGRELKLEMRFDDDARELYDTISDLENARRAVRDGLRYWMIFRYGMTARTDHVLQLLRRMNGPASVASLAARCAGELDDGEVRAAVSRLAELGHVVVDGDTVQLTRKGRHV